ncbi:MAG: glycosyltransferase family protein [Gemmataceae bacterium]
MRIVYGVHGYGRGHATRSLALISRLAAQHRFLILAGGDAHNTIYPDFPVTQIPTLGFSYGQRSGKRCTFRTIRRNLAALLDARLRGPTFEMIESIMREFAPDVVISDAEVWTHRVAEYLRIPRISVDHFGILAYCKPPVDRGDRFEAGLDALVYRMLMGRPDRIVVSSFYDAPPRWPGVKVVPALVRPELHSLQPVEGGHLLVYFNRSRWQLSKRILETLEQAPCPVRIYGDSERGRRGNLEFVSPSNLPFLEDLASCKGVISTAGNQLMGEAIYFGKPVLVMPEECVEQRMNAAAVQRLGIGLRTTPQRFCRDELFTFLDRIDLYRERMRHHVRDGLEDAIAAVEGFLHELVPARASRRAGLAASAAT